MLSLPSSVTMPVIQFSVHGFAFFNTFIMTVNTWWNCLSLYLLVQWVCGQMALSTLFLQSVFILLHYLTSYKNFHTDSNQCLPFPLNSAQGLLQHFSCQPTHACEQSHNSSRKQNFRCLTLMTRQMQQQTPPCPGYPLEQAIFRSQGCQPLQIIQICPGKHSTSLPQKKNHLPWFL